MAFKLQQWQIDELVRLKDHPAASDGLHPLAKAYRLLASWATGHVADGVDTNSIAWLKGAADINEGIGAASTFIRNYTSYQHQLRYGTPLSNSELQKLSDDIAVNVINTVITNHNNALILIDIPDINTIGNTDAIGVVQDKFNRDFNAWSGVVLFQFLGKDSYLNDMLQHSTALNPYDGTYNALAAISSLQHASGLSLLDALLNIGTTYKQYSNIADPFTYNKAVEIAGDLSGFISSSYGISNFSALDSNAVLGKLSTANGHDLNDTITTNSSVREIIHAGGGDDIIKSSSIGDMGDVIDGGDGRDIVDYSGATFEINLTSDADSYANHRLLAEARFLPIDYSVLVNIEELRLGQDNDHVNITISAANPLERLDTNGGNDDVSINLVAGHSFKELHTGTGDDIVSITGAATAFKPTIYLEDGNDILNSATRGSIVYGGAGSDTFQIGQDYLIADADTTDVIMYGTQVLHGGVTWEGQESPWAKGMGGIRYGKNSDGELVIKDPYGRETFVANFNKYTQAKAANDNSIDDVNIPAMIA